MTFHPRIKPMLAENYVESKLTFPLIAEPKIDGFRGLNMQGGLIGRSLDPFKNIYTTGFYSSPGTLGFDGELAFGSPTDPALCRATTGALNRIEGEPKIDWWLFDYVTPDTVAMQYMDRLLALTERHNEVCFKYPQFADVLRIIPYFLVQTLEQLYTLDAQWLADGYEGTIIRDPHGTHKQGRSTPREGGLLRIKRFVEEDATVLAIIEGNRNDNEATTNSLGRTERSSHAENLVPNGMVGSMTCRDEKTGKKITVGAGAMPHDDRLAYFKNPKALIGQTIKYRHFPKGVKDLPRFPTFHSLRSKNDKVAA
jgi:DNA ligase-1